jgi:hypothetical protein
MVDYVNAIIYAQGGTTEHTQWGLVSPIRIYWKAAERLQDERFRTDQAVRQFTQDVEEWLASVPLPPSLDYSRADYTLNDLLLLARTVFTIPSVREKLGTRLIQAHEGKVGYDLPAVLREAGYLSPSVKEGG